MDTKKDSKIPKCGPALDFAGKRMVVGAKQLKKAVQNGCALCVFLAEDADPALTEPLELLCRDKQIPITWVVTMAALGSACGIEVGAAAAAAVG